MNGVSNDHGFFPGDNSFILFYSPLVKGLFSCSSLNFVFRFYITIITLHLTKLAVHITTVAVSGCVWLPRCEEIGIAHHYVDEREER